MRFQVKTDGPEYEVTLLNRYGDGWTWRCGVRKGGSRWLFEDVAGEKLARGVAWVCEAFCAGWNQADGFSAVNPGGKKRGEIAA